MGRILHDGCQFLPPAFPGDYSFSKHRPLEAWAASFYFRSQLQSFCRPAAQKLVDPGIGTVLLTSNALLSWGTGKEGWGERAEVDGDNRRLPL